MSGPIGSANLGTTPQIWSGQVRSVASPAAGSSASPPGSGGDVSLEFVDTDVREMVAQVLGTILRVNYSIDPAVRGTVTLRTVRPLERSRVLQLMQAALAQAGATVVGDANLYRVVPLSAAGGSPALAGGGGLTGGSLCRCATRPPRTWRKCCSPIPGRPAACWPTPGATRCSSPATRPRGRRCST